MMKKQLIISGAIVFSLVIATAAIVLYGKGYRLWFDQGKPDLSGTGLLVATSNPDGAQVFINDHLTTATDSTINLAPGEYTVKIYKEGYFPWQKNITIQNEVVAKADALLFATAPKLESLTTIGVENPKMSPSMTNIAYTVASQSAKKNGIYVLDLTTHPLLTLQSASNQIIDDTYDTFSNSSFAWSPDGSSLIATVSASPNYQPSYLLSTTSFNDSPKDITTTLDSTLLTWEKDKEEKEKSQLGTLNAKLQDIVLQNFLIIAWSPDETKILYTASSSATIPAIINPPLIGADQKAEQRKLEIGSTYVYDIKEDKNYKILDASSQTKAALMLQWYPDSKHLVYTHEKKIDIMEYDGGNKTTVYAGPFVDGFVFPYPNDSKIVILTNLDNPFITPNLYTVGLK